MNCTHFLARFSEYWDGHMRPEERARAEAHLGECASCRRYRDVVEEGVERLRSFSGVTLPEDFRSRVRRRLRRDEDPGGAPGGPDSSATSVTAALGMAVLLVAAAWSPGLRDAAAEVRMSPIVVSQPVSTARPTLSVPPEAFFPARSSPRFDASDPWRDPGALLYEFSPLQRRYPAGSRLRAGLD